MKRILFFLLLTLTIPSLGQNRTYLGIETGLPFDIYDAVDNGNGLYTKPFMYSPMWGLTIGQEFKEHFTLESGVYRKYYGQSYRLRNRLGYGISNAIDAWQIPLRLKSRINLFQDKISLTGTIGYSFAINSDYGSYGWGSGQMSSLSDNVSYTDSSNYSLRRNFSLMETGVGLEFKIFKTALLTVSSSYYTGFNKIVIMNVAYTINNEPTQTATVFSKGDYFNFMVGLKYPLSKIWNKQTKADN